MPVSLSASVYTAGHGYAWSATPAGVEESTLGAILADALATRPDFAEENAVTTGIIARNGIAAAFAIRRAQAWDAEGRDADYAAFVFVPYAEARNIDFGFLLANPFFSEPTRTPPTALTYDGPAAEAFPLTAPGRLLCHNRHESFPASAVGTLLAQYGTKVDRWLFVAEGDAFTITTSPWHR